MFGKSLKCLLHQVKFITTLRFCLLFVYIEFANCTVRQNVTISIYVILEHILSRWTSNTEMILIWVEVKLKIRWTLDDFKRSDKHFMNNILISKQMNIRWTDWSLFNVKWTPDKGQIKFRKRSNEFKINIRWILDDQKSKITYL